MNSSNNNYDDKTISKAREKVESYLRHNYENINSVEFNDDMSDPMGGLMIRGTVNGKAEFSASVDPKEFKVNSMGEKEGFPKVKEECKEEVCDY
ncbi:hypothetical protein A21D_01550 [Virgibacillus dokdonensis]|uniref:DUF1433 domain-containing protein n=1 Tax=Virgibacillus dokdonensis TaxID=302167 RepID=A0A2K9J3P5_9BACI|nr:hypothetical protein A21D_01550 [Virgibacillus dokdonensis]